MEAIDLEELRSARTATENYFQPKKLVLVERPRLMAEVQKPDQSVQELKLVCNQAS